MAANIHPTTSTDDSSLLISPGSAFNSNYSEPLESADGTAAQAPAAMVPARTAVKGARCFGMCCAPHVVTKELEDHAEFLYVVPLEWIDDPNRRQSLQSRRHDAPEMSHERRLVVRG